MRQDYSKPAAMATRMKRIDDRSSGLNVTVADCNVVTTSSLEICREDIRHALIAEPILLV